MTNSINDSLKNTSINNFIEFCEQLEWKVGVLGGRRLVDKSKTHKGSLCLNDLIKHFHSQSNANPSKTCEVIINKINVLHEVGEFELHNASLFKKLFTSIKRFFSYKMYDRADALKQIQDSSTKKSKANFSNNSSLEKHVGRQIAGLPISDQTKSFIDNNPWTVDQLIIEIESKANQDLHLDELYIDQKFNIARYLEKLTNEEKQVKREKIRIIINKAYVNRELKQRGKFIQIPK